MTTSRRQFVWQSAAALGVGAVAPACNRALVRETRASGAGDYEPAYLELERRGELAERAEALWRELGSCETCARECGADRLAGETAVCSTPATIRVYSAAAHHGEERELVGTGGSGTVFFSHCNLLCCFCQNWEINHRGDGDRTSERELAEIMLALQEHGCHNINLVTPSHVVPQIVTAVRIAARRGLRLPLVYNTGGYDSLETIERLDGIVDIYLPDFKYQDGEMAALYSAGASDYPEVAAAAIREMHRQVGGLQVDERGVATRGLIVRHLVLPHNIAGTDRFVQWVADELGPDTSVNLMAQYRPEYQAHDIPEISRRITQAEWRQAVRWAEEAGLTNVRT